MTPEERLLWEIFSDCVFSEDEQRFIPREDDDNDRPAGKGKGG